MLPRFPIYIISKGRAKNGLTWKALDHMKVDYKIIVDESEYEEYASVLDKSKLMVCPDIYKLRYNTFWANEKTTGPGAARNYAWHHSIQKGYSHHWVMDDNLDAFHRLNRNIKAEVDSGTIFRCMEDFTLRYDNIAISGPNYYSFVKSTDAVKPYTLNTRIYSCLLINNSLTYRWRGKYNEDTDLAIRALKDGWCTVQFNAFLQGKVTTQRMNGGNHEQFYSKEGTLNKSKMLAEMHPDIAKVVWRFNRWHHHVDYKQFKKNKLNRITEPKDVVNNYGMALVEE